MLNNTDTLKMISYLYVKITEVIVGLHDLLMFI